MVDGIVFIIAACVILGGAVGVIFNPNPVHAALSLIATFFGVAILFVLQEVHFLALVQVVVYGGAVVVLFLFVIMLLGVEEIERFDEEPIEGQRIAALGGSLVLLGVILAGLFLSGPGGEDGAVAITGKAAQMVPLTAETDVVQLANDLFTRHVYAFEATGLLLTIATVGAVVLVKNRGAEDLVVDEPGTSVR